MAQAPSLGCRLQQVTVDGEAVVGVALWSVSARFPLRNQADEQPDLVKVFDNLHQVGARGQQALKEVTCLVGPGFGHRLRLRCQAFESKTVQVGPLSGGSGCNAQHEQGIITDRCLVGEKQPVSVEPDAATHVHHLRSGPTHRPRPPLVSDHSPEASCDTVDRPCNGTSRRGDIGHESVGVTVPKPLGHLVLQLEEKSV